MIFGRKKSEANAEPDDQVDPTAAEEVDPADGTEERDVADETATGVVERDTDEWAEFDLSQDWRAEGPFDFDEVDLEADQIERLDFGSMIITPPPNCEVRLQVAEGTQSIVSVLIVVGESAMELSAFSAPRTPGLWAEIRQQIVDQTAQAGGTSDSVEGPFGTELVRNLPVRLPDGQSAIQPSRTWVAEGPRWLLRGVLMGRAALSDEIEDDIVGPLFDAFSDVIVRRSESPMPVGDLLPLTLPPQVERMEPVEPQG